MKGYIKHHGILGQKWGIRRYQNKDGSLTSAGKMRYRDDGTKLTLANMTDEEYDYAMKQMQREKAFNDLKSSSGTGLGKFGSTELTKLGITAVATAATIGLTAALSDEGIKDGKKLVKSILLAVGTTSIADIATSLNGKVATVPQVKQQSTGTQTQQGIAADKYSSYTSKVGSPQGFKKGTDDNAYASFFQRSPTDEQKQAIKKMRKDGYSPSQIEEAVFHSNASILGEIYIGGIL